MCDYVKILLEYNKGYPNHVISYKAGKIICRHVNNSMCIQLNEDNLPLTRSSHSSEKFVYYIHRNKIDTIPFLPYNSLHNIRSKFLKFGFFMVDDIRGEKLKYVRQYLYHPTKFNTYQLIKENNMITMWNKNIRFGYDYYSGTTKIENVYFEKKTHAHLQMYGPLIGTFQFTEMNEPPPVNGMICGYVDLNDPNNLNRSDGSLKYMNYWFRCSVQFYLLYLLLVDGKSHEVFHGKNKNQIMDMLETNRSLKIIGNLQSKADQYEHIDTEPSSVEYCDIYKAIAELFYFQSDIPFNDRKIPETFRLPTSPDIYKQNLLYAFG